MLSFFRPELLSVTVFALALSIGTSVSSKAEDDEVFELGKRIFMSEAEPSCAICHTLSDADAAGEIGPNLDELKPTEDRVRLAVEGGVGAMPPYEESLTQEEIDAVSLYVARVTGASE